MFKLTDRVEGMMDEESSHAPIKRPQVQETVLDLPTKQVEYVKEIQVSSEETIPINQIREFITGTIKIKYEVATKSSLTYARPYTARIDSLKMPTGYQPPKFQQFDGKGSPKQYVAHFIEICNNAGTYGDYLVKQFVRSLKGNAFDWYTDLESGSIDSWEQMEQEFLNRFCSTRCTVSMVELTNTRQGNEEPVFDFINRWRHASLNCKDRHSEASGIEMCIQDEVGRSDDRKYYKYHRLVGHPIEKCFVFKDKIMDLAREGKIELEDEKLSSNQVTVASDLPNPVMTCNFVEGNMEQDIPNTNQTRMIKFGDFEPIDVNNLLSLPILSDVASVGEGSTRRRKVSSHKESTKRHVREKMFTYDGTKALCCNVDEKEAKYATPSCPSPKDTLKPSPKVENTSCPSPKDAPQPSPGVENTCMAKITLSDDDLLFGDTFHNCPLFMVGFACEKRVNRILVDGGSGINILPIRTMKELGISTEDLTDSRLMIQGFNQGGQRSIGTVKIDLTIGELQSSVWLHVIDAKTSYNIFLGRPWVHEKKVIPSTYHQCLKYYEDGVAKRIIVDDNPFTEAEAHFANAKFYLKKYSTKVDNIASRDVGILNKMAKVVVGKAKEDKGHSLKLRENVLEGLTLPVRRIDMMKSSTKLLGKSVAHKSLLHGKFVAPKSLQYKALPMKRTEEGFDPTAYRMLAKAGFDPNEPSK
ncbi:hypothetical protein KY289_008056 [Solanum tuberosum]|nr:hypothetical protein KY289_008056 [Solanum tuberosum]